MLSYICLLLLLAVKCLAQDDPQDIADIACEYNGAMYEFNTNTGIIESPGYPHSYGDHESCQWYINPEGGIPEGQHLYLEIKFFRTESGAYDILWVIEGRGIFGEELFLLDGSYDPGTFFSLGDQPVTLFFGSDASVSYEGFQVEFSIAESSPGQEMAGIACDPSTSPAYITNINSTLIETIGYPNEHTSNTFCEWSIQPESTTEGMYLSVIYFFAESLYIYFNEDGAGDYEDFWGGIYESGYSIYSPGSAMFLSYYGYESYPGFQLVTYPADPACTSGSGSQITVNVSGEVKSPGYPYEVPEHLSCRWLLQATGDQKLIINCLDLDLYGDGVDCEDEYVEILDGDTVDALSLGKFCGNTTFGSIPSAGSSLQIYFRTRERSSDTTELHTGFAFNFQATG